MFRRKGLLTLLAFAVAPLWAQVDSSGAPPAGEGAAIWTMGHSSGNDSSEDDAPMVTPAPLSGEGYSMAFSSETPRTNFLRGGLNLSTAYDSNVVPSSGRAVSDVAYSILPSLALEQSRSRLRWNLSYSPGYTFHQRLDTINGLDHSLALGLEYRLSPHVTMKLSNSFQKTRDLLNFREQSEQTPTPGGLNGPNDSIVPPGTAMISNFSNAEISYQFGPNAMVGAQRDAVWIVVSGSLSDSRALRLHGSISHGVLRSSPLRKTLHRGDLWISKVVEPGPVRDPDAEHVPVLYHLPPAQLGIVFFRRT